MSAAEFTFGRCPHCAEPYRLPAEAVGRQARCRGCATVFVVEAGAATAIQDEPNYVAELIKGQPEPADGPQPALGDEEKIDAISEHIARHLGPVYKVFHEITSDLVHIDLHWVQADERRPYHTLVTSGMSDLPMTVPEGAEEFRFAELLLRLPLEWRLDADSFRDENWYWPLRCLKQLARYPHDFKTFLAFGHSTANEEPFAPNTKLSGVVLLFTLGAPAEFNQLTFGGRTIHFYSVIPLYPEELEHKLRYGLEKLLPRFDRYGISDVIDPQRRNVCRRKFGLW